MFSYWMAWFRTLKEDSKGQGLVEYALIIALVSIGVTVALTSLKDGIVGVFGDIVGSF